MSGWDSLNSQAGGKTTTKSTGWGSLNSSAQVSQKVATQKAGDQKYQNDAKYANSLKGLLMNTLKGLPQASGIPQAFNAGVDQTNQGYNQLFGSNQSITQRGEGLLNLGAGAVNTVFSPTAPITQPVGKVIQYAGDQMAQTPLLQRWGANNPQNGVPTPLERGLGAVVNASTIVGAVAPVLGSRIPGLKKPVGYTQAGDVPITPPLQIPRNTDYQSVPVMKPLAVRSANTEATPVNVQTPYLRTNEMPVIQFGQKTATKNNLPSIDYSSLFNKENKTPVLRKSKDEIFQPVDDLKMRYEFKRQALDESPAKGLLKYVSRTTGELPEIVGRANMQSLTGSGKKVKTSTFGRSGDDILMSEGFDDIRQAQNAVEQYKNNREQLQTIKTKIQEETTKARVFLKQQPKPKKIKPELPLRYISIKELVQPSGASVRTFKSSVLQKPTTSKQLTSKPEAVRITSVKGTGTIKTRGLSLGVEANAIEKRLTTKLGELPEYETVNMKEQAQHGARLISEDYENARSIALGEKAPPKGVLPESVFVAVENLAIKEGDIATLQDLANSKLTSQATTMGQRIRTLGERDPDSPVEAIQEVQKARQESIAKRTDIKKEKAKTVSEIETHIKKNVPKKEDWNSFISSIQC